MTIKSGDDAPDTLKILWKVFSLKQLFCDCGFML